MRDAISKIDNNFCIVPELAGIYNLETALDNSKRLPFSPDWFVFGQDNYYSYWICFKRKTITGCYFTYWDHESGCSMEEPVWKDLLSFLK